MAYKQPNSSAYSSGGYNEPPSYPMLASKESHSQKYNAAYGGNSVPQPAPSGAQRANPRAWSKRTKIIVGTVTAIILIVVIIVAAVVGTEKNKYPDYKALTYNIADTYEPANFFSNFQYWDTYDPTGGFVHYDNPVDSTSPIRNTTFESPSSAYVQVDHTEQNAITGRHSARVQSLKQYNDGLFIFDVKHSPYGCATWPAIWLADAYNWPTNGEVDIVEAVNQGNTGVQSTLHTTKGCTMNVKRKETGKISGTNCWNGTDNNNGCGVMGPVDSYGAALNANGGGVYAAELRSEGIRIWFFARASLPGDVSAAINTGSSDTTHPDPSKWGDALADFPSTDCDIGSHFRNQSIIVNVSLCGQWAGRVYATDNCPSSCETYVAQNPAAFDQAYWELGRFKVYQAA